MKSLAPQQVESYRYNGFLYPVPALTPAEVATCLAGVARLENELGSPIADADIKWRSHAYAHSPWFNELIRHPRILDAVEDLIGPDILVWTSTFFITETLDESDPVVMSLPAGSFSLHHELAVHRSAPNNASHRRIGIGLNYIPAYVRVEGPVRLRAMLVRGKDRYGQFDLIDPPSAERDAAALAVHKQVSEAYGRNYNEQVRRHEHEFQMRD